MTTVVDTSELENAIRGSVLTADSPGWDDARAAWNLLIDQRPAVVALPDDAEDVATIVRWAATNGLRVSAQTTGHRAGTIGDLAGTVLVKTSRINEIQVDAEAGTVRAGAGAIWGDVFGAATASGLVPLSGTAASVAGYTLGGGIGWLSRQFGLACNNVVAMDVVTADGQLRTVDATTEPELFWALRGGGGDFAIVTSFELRAFPVTEIFAGSYFWPVERAAEVFSAWARWQQGVPNELSSCARIFHFPPLPFIPEQFRGRSLVSVEVVLHGSADDGQRLVQPFVDLEPEMGGCEPTSPAALLTLHQDPPNPGPAVGDGILLEQLDDDTVAAFCSAATGAEGRRLVSIEVRQIGGALAEPATDAGVLSRLPGTLAVYAAGVVSPAADASALHGSIATVKDAVRSAATPRGYTNFAHEAGDLSAYFSTEELTRLGEVKRTYDPSNVIRGTNPVPTT